MEESVARLDISWFFGESYPSHGIIRKINEPEALSSTKMPVTVALTETWFPRDVQ